MFSSKLLTLASLCVLSSCAPASHTNPTATIEAGVVVGTTTAVSGAASATVINKFLGVPFAASPTRFAPPASATPWSQPFNATHYGKTCPQEFDYPEATRKQTMEFFDNPPPPGGEGEDCLNVNIFAPASSGGNKTVMVWIYGGSLTFGSNADVFYDGSSFAANQDVIIVAINYRTNVFGFPNAPQLPLNASNLGFLDQRFALDWVQRNIHAFGGSPQKVTIFGESAGAFSVDNLVVSTPNNPPFRAAIGQSGTVDGLYDAPNTSTGPMAWAALVKSLKCTGDELACVRAASVSTILNITEHNAIQFTPTIDNYTLLPHAETLRSAGKVAHVPWMTGTNANEGRIFVLGVTNTTEALISGYGLTAQQAMGLESLYPIPSLYINDSYTQIAQIATDFSFQCLAAIAFNDTHKAGIPAYRYLYNATFANLEPAPGLGVFHSSEIPMVFGTYPRKGATSEQMTLSRYMQTAWATFAKNPSQGPGWKGWPEVAVLGPVPGPKGYSGTGTNYELSVEGPKGRMLDGRCEVYQPLYELGSVY